MISVPFYIEIYPFQFPLSVFSDSFCFLSFHFFLVLVLLAFVFVLHLFLVVLFLFCIVLFSHFFCCCGFVYLVLICCAALFGSKRIHIPKIQQGFFGSLHFLLSDLHFI